MMVKTRRPIVMTKKERNARRLSVFLTLCFYVSFAFSKYAEPIYASEYLVLYAIHGVFASSVIYYIFYFSFQRWNRFVENIARAIISKSNVDNSIHIRNYNVQDGVIME